MERTKCCPKCWDDIGHDTALGCFRPKCPCHQERSDWEKGFEVLARKLNLREETVDGTDEQGMVRNFIRETLSSARSEWENEPMTVEQYAHIHRDCITDRAALVKSVEGMSAGAEGDYGNGYVDAVYDFVALLSTKKED